MNSYARAVGAAALQGLLTGVWVAAGELPPAKRRLSRAGAVVTLSGIASIRDWAFPEEPARRPALTAAPGVEAGPGAKGGSGAGAGPGANTQAGNGVEVEDGAGEGQGEVRPVSKGRLIAGGVGVAVSVVTMIGARRLEKRWLASLTRAGHPHPHRALGVRMGLISFAAAAPRGLIRAYDAGRRL
ncbi:hypothetical protein Asp14428_55620 [Actinoplanes sp. NBRC 14428]|nr:hypothetical protein Asp14428_55620 [Actinoplanes sp. NBRC 14428]